MPEHFRRVFPFVRVSGNRPWVSGHGATNPDGTLYPKLGKVGTDLTKEEAYEAARLTGLAIIASLKDELGNLARAHCCKQDNKERRERAPAYKVFKPSFSTKIIQAPDPPLF